MQHLSDLGRIGLGSRMKRLSDMTMRDAEQKMGTTHSYISQKAKYLVDEGLITLQAESSSPALSLKGEGEDNGRDRHAIMLHSNIPKYAKL